MFVLMFVLMLMAVVMPMAVVMRALGATRMLVVMPVVSRVMLPMLCHPVLLVRCELFERILKTLE